MIEASETSPKINFNKDSGMLLMEGKSLMDEPVRFYKTINDWLKTYVKQPASQTELIIKLEYLNTETSKQFLDFFSILKETPGTKVVWSFSDEDEDMEEMGQELAELSPIPFEFRTY